MEWINKSKILIVGLGLIGGSYAKALKRMGYQIMAIDTDADSIKYALDKGIIDEGSVTADPKMIAEADTAIFALYPEIFKQWIAENQRYFRSNIRITDVTGVKCNVVYDIQAMLRDDLEFIAAHPMAGREVNGVQYSDDRIFRDANFIVVPTPKNTDAAIEWCVRLGRILGFRKVSVLTPEEHDKMIAYVSQLTHCIAVTLMTCNDDHHLVDYTGDSFRDLTRIARINETMWSELFNMNKKELLAQIDTFSAELQNLRNMLENGDTEGLKEKMRISTLRRSWFDEK